ncbi:MAG TPA: hypothetical protein VK534_01715 [Methylomirabilota bacterium]|nr:hypothetical protein [Methylomirabilota bacterium]
MEDAKQQLATKLKSANNILVTVSRDPSVDQLSALLGLTLALNKQGKHAAAVFSGEVPSTLEFLQPDETIEKNTDSLRDFIIALDKSKADKLRYKVEDNVVRIFITPYRTSINQDDFEFSEGDFNVDVVVALGVKQQEDLDEAIIAHGRILHDATVASINLSPDGGLGTINWHDPAASSLSEQVTQLIQSLGPDQLDEQIATALLTGIVAETDRFRNEKTSAETMTISAALMAAGANQQLVVSKLDQPVTSAPSDDGEKSQPTEELKPNDDGAIQIEHDKDEDKPEPTPPAPTPPPEPDVQPDAGPQITPVNNNMPSGVSPGAKLITEPPTMGGTLTANTQEEPLEPSIDPLGIPTEEPPQLLDRKPPQEDTVPETPPATPTAQPPAGPSDKTLTDLEKEVQSPHVEPAAPAEASTTGLDTARSEVNQALTDAYNPDATPSEPIQALNAQPLGNNDLHPSPAKATDAAPSLEEQIPGFSPTLQSSENTQPPASATTDPASGSDEQPSGSPTPPPSNDPNAPPPVPPPIPFQFGNPPPPQ